MLVTKNLLKFTFACLLTLTSLPGVAAESTDEGEATPTEQKATTGSEPSPSFEGDEASTEEPTDLGSALSLFRESRDADGESSGSELLDELLEGAVADSDIDLTMLTDEDTQSAVDALKGVVDENGLKPDFEIDSRVISTALLFDSHEELRRVIETLVKELHKPGDHEDVKVVFNSSFYPSTDAEIVDEVKEVQDQLDEIRKKRSSFNPGVYTGIGGVRSHDFMTETDPTITALKDRLKKLAQANGGVLPEGRNVLRIRISAGTLAFIKNYDELAAVISQALSRLNPRVFKAAQNRQVRDALSKVAGYQDLHKDEQKLIQSDLAAVERLTQAGFNPWALHRFERRTLDKMEEKILSKKWRYALNRVLLMSSLNDVKDDPIRPLRHAAMEAWIGLLTSTEKINKEDKPLPPQLSGLNKRLAAYIKPYYSLLGTLSVSAGGATLITGGQPIIWTLSALGLAPTALVPIAVAAGGVIAEVALGTFGAVTAGTLLYGGWKNRDNLGGAIQGSVKNVGIRGARTILGTFIKGRKVLQIGGNISGKVIRSFGQGALDLGQGALALGIRTSRTLIIAPTQEAYKQIAYVAETGNTLRKARRQRTRVLQLYNQYSTADKQKLAKLGQMVSTVQSDLRSAHHVLEDFRARKQEMRTRGWRSRQISRLVHRPVLAVRAATTRSFYIHLLEEFATILENQAVEDETITEFFAEIDRDPLPLDLTDSGNFQQVAARIGTALQRKNQEHLLERSTLENETLPALPDQPLMRMSQAVSFFTGLHTAMEEEDLLEIMSYSNLLSQKGLTHTHSRLLKEYRYKSLRFAIANYQTLTEAQRTQLIKFSQAFSHFNGDVVLDRKFYKGITEDDVLALVGLADVLNISFGARLKRLTKSTVESIIAREGGKENARNYIRSFVHSKGGNLDHFVAHLYGNGENIEFANPGEILDYMNYLLDRNNSSLIDRATNEGAKPATVQEVISVFDGFSAEIAKGTLTEEHLKTLARSKLLDKFSQEDLNNEELINSAEKFYSSLKAKKSHSLIDFLRDYPLDFNPINFARHMHTVRSFEFDQPEESMKHEEFYSAMLFLTKNHSYTHTMLYEWISDNLISFLKGSGHNKLHFKLSIEYSFLLFVWTKMGVGKGFKFFNMVQENQGITFLTMLPKAKLREAVEVLTPNDQARILARLIPIQYKKEGFGGLGSFLEDKYWKKHTRVIKTFFSSPFPDGKKMEKVIEAFVVQFAQKHRSLERFLFEARRLFPIGVRENTLVTRLFQAVSKTDFSVSSDAILSRVVDTFLLNTPSGANNNYYLENAGNAFLDIISYSVQELLNQGKDGQKIQQRLNEIFAIPGLKERLYIRLMDQFPTQRLTELSIAIENSSTWGYVDYLSQDPADLAKQGFKLDYFAHLSRSLQSIETNYDPKLLLNIISHILYIGKQTDKSFVTLNGINFRAHTILVRLFRKHGSDLAKYVLQKDADLPSRQNFFNMLNHLSKSRIYYEKVSKAGEGDKEAAALLAQLESHHREGYRLVHGDGGTVSYHKSVNSILDAVKNPGKKFLGFEFGAEYLYPEKREIWKIITSKLDAKEKLAWRTLSTMYRYRSNFNLFEDTFLLKSYAKSWVRSVNNLVELDHLITQEVASRGTNMQAFSDRLFELIKKSPKLLTTLDDAKAMLSNDAFWPEVTLNTDDVSLLEKPFIKIIENRLNDPNTNKGSWKYAPAFSESAHLFIIERLTQNNQMPQNFDGLFKFWIELTNRGVTSHSDKILNQLLEMATAEQSRELEDFAIVEQRIFETTARDELIVQRIQGLSEYKDLTSEESSLSENQRMDSLKNIVETLQGMMPERGLRYEQFLEELSVEIMSSQAESQYLHQQKGLGDNSNVKTSDSNIMALHKVIKQISSWPNKEQFAFVLFLRGDAEPTKFLKRKFPNVGPERIKRMYEILPVEYRVGVLDFFLGQTFFKYAEDLNVKKGYPRKLIEQAVTGGRKETDPRKVKAQDVTRQILLAGLVGIKDGSGDAEFQKLILANILAVSQNSNGSIGQTLKLVLEKGFGPLGVKIGQLIVAMNILDKDDAKALIDVQDNARPLQREEQYQEFRDIVGNARLPFTMKELLGSASIKWAVQGRMNNNQQKVAIKVFRQEVEVMLENRYKVLESMVDYLVANVGKEYKILSAIIASAKRAVEKELDGEAEESQSKRAKDLIYINLDDDESKVIVPHEAFESGRIIVSEFVEGMSFHRLPESIKHIAAAKILKMEGDILFSDQDEITFDPDRHGGNYRIHLPKYDGQRHVVLEPIEYGVIDFGQLLTIKKDVRSNLVEIFAISQIISESGAHRILTEKLAEMFDLKDDKVDELRRVLRTYFPNPKLKEQTAYFATLSALHEVGVELDPGYFDFARAVMQLMQYEPYVPEDFETPSRKLQGQIVERIAAYLRELAADRPNAIMARNAVNWFQSKVSSKTYRPITTDIDAATVLGFKFDGSVWQDDKPQGAPVVPAVFGFTCEAQFR